LHFNFIGINAKKIMIGLLFFKGLHRGPSKLPNGRLLDLFKRIHEHSLIASVSKQIRVLLAFHDIKVSNLALRGILLNNLFVVGLKLLQKFGGANGIVFYASSIFELAGSERFFGIPLYIGVMILGKQNTDKLILLVY
jgi:hypothetical protein